MPLPTREKQREYQRRWAARKKERERLQEEEYKRIHAEWLGIKPDKVVHESVAKTKKDNE